MPLIALNIAKKTKIERLKCLYKLWFFDLDGMLVVLRYNKKLKLP